MPQTFRKFDPKRAPAGAPAWSHPDWARTPSRRKLGGTAEEAAWYSCEGFEHLRARIEFLSSRLQQARAALPAERSNLLDGVLDALDGLKTGVAGIGQPWEPWPVGALAGVSRRASGAGFLPGSAEPEPEPWDAETAEALTRVCEVAAFEDHRTGPSHRLGREPVQDAIGSAATVSRTGLEARLAALAERLQQALPRLDPAQWLAPIDTRIGQLEHDLTAALQAVSARSDAHGLGRLEALVRDLATRAQHTGSELARLDAIEQHLAEVLAQLKSFDALVNASAALPAAPSPPRPGAQTTLDELLKACAAARRQDARTAVAVLRSIHHALAEVVERLNSAPCAASALTATAGTEADPYGDHDLLLKAYREGARALGESVADAAQEPGGLTAANRSQARYGAPRWYRQRQD